MTARTVVEASRMSFSAGSLRTVLDAHTPPNAAGYLVALSGGADSACLLTALAELRARPGGNLPVRAIHIDHGLQSAAADFRRTCEQLCRRLNVPLIVEAVAVDMPRGESIEAAARAARYAGLSRHLEAGECLLTAHHAQDQAETLLLQALRGAGLKGLTAMPICRAWHTGWHLRPLLDVDQRDLRTFAAHAGIEVVSDPMNRDTRFDRIYVRERLWPLIEGRWPAAARTLSRAARHLAEAQELLDESAASTVEALRDGAALSVPVLRRLSHAEQCNAVRFWLAERAARPPSTAHLTEGLRQMMAADADHVPAITWSGHALRRYRSRLYLTEAHAPCVGEPRDWAVGFGKTLKLGDGLGTLLWSVQSGGLDAARLPSVISVRQRRGGETLKPHRRARTQSVQHLCQSLGILPWMRDALPLLYSGNELIAVGDLWQDAGWCVAPGAPGLGCVWTGAPILT